MTNLYPTISDYPSATGVMPMLFAIRDGVPFAFEGLLFAILIIFTFAQYFIQKRGNTRSKILMSLLTSEFAVIVLSVILALAQLVTFQTVLLHAFLLIVFFILVLLSDYW